MRSAGVADRLSEKSKKDPSKSYREKFDEQRLNVPRFACISCRKLTVPSNIRKINIDTWKVFKQRDDLEPDHPYVQLGLFLIENDELGGEEGTGMGLDEEILHEYEETRGADNDDDNESGGDSDDNNENTGNRLLLVLESFYFCVQLGKGFRLGIFGRKVGWKLHCAR